MVAGQGAERGSYVDREAVSGDESGSFVDRVKRVVAATRPGEVVTYGEVAAESGAPGAARAVGRVMRDHGAELPWWRVVTATGRLVPGLEERHAARLAAEGVPCADGRVARPRAGGAAPLAPLGDADGHDGGE